MQLSRFLLIVDDPNPDIVSSTDFKLSYENTASVTYKLLV